MADILRVRTELTYGQGGPGLSTFYFLPGTAGGVTADALDVAARVRNFWLGVDHFHHTTFVAQVSGAVDVLDATDGSLVGFLDAGSWSPVAGTSALELLPVAAMVLLQHFTGDVHMGRRVRGRSFIGPVTELANSGGVPSSTVRTDTVTAAAALQTGATASVPVVWSRPDSPPGDPGFHSEVLSYGTASFFAALRSRRDS